MAIFRGCSNLVIRCFKRVEHFADWLTGAAGPVFVFFCWCLISLGAFAFFDVVGRDLSWWTLIVFSPAFALAPLNMFGQYYLVTHVPPGYPSSRAMALSPHKPISIEKEERWLTRTEKSPWVPEYWGMRSRGESSRSYRHSLTTNGNAGGNGHSGKRTRRCRKCDAPKPERTHHCSVCKRCILMMDHHCPWINACVGLHNQRHFVLFMTWLSFACWILAAFGWRKLLQSFTFGINWPSYTPRLAYTLIYILSIAMGFAVPVLGSWHLFMVGRNETSIESHDNAYLETRAKAEGLIYLNPYDFGRRRNLELFFNLGPEGYSKWTLLFPLTVPPASDGWSFPRRALPSDSRSPLANGLHAPELAEGLIDPGRAGGSAAENGHGGSRYVMGDNGDLTDDEEGGGGFMDADQESDVR